MKVFRAGYLWDGEKLRRNGTLYVEGGTITEPGEGEIIDLGNRLVMPGLVNAHTHVAMVLMRGLADGLPLNEWLKRMWAIEEKLDDKALRIASLYGLIEMVSSGVTSFMDFYNIPPMVWALKKLKLRAVLTLAFMDRVEYMKDESWKRVKEVDRYLEMANEAGASLALGPHAPYTCTPELLSEVARLSRNYGLKVHTHLAETLDEITLVKREFGKRPFDLLMEAGLVNERLIAAHGVHLSAPEMAELGRAGSTIVHCPRSNARLGAGIAKVEEMIKFGVNVALGTDGPASSENFDMFEEARLALYLLRGRNKRADIVSVQDVMKMATENGKKALGLGSGRLKPGDPADFVVLRPDKISWDVLASALYSSGKVEEVYIGGRLTYDHGNIPGVDVEDVSKELLEIRGQLE